MVSITSTVSITPWNVMHRPVRLSDDMKKKWHSQNESAFSSVTTQWFVTLFILVALPVRPKCYDCNTCTTSLTSDLGPQLVTLLSDRCMRFNDLQFFNPSFVITVLTEHEHILFRFSLEWAKPNNWQLIFRLYCSFYMWPI